MISRLFNHLCLNFYAEHFCEMSHYFYPSGLFVKLSGIAFAYGESNSAFEVSLHFEATVSTPWNRWGSKATSEFSACLGI